MDSSLSVSSSGLSSLIKKLYSLIFNYPSWSIYTYPKILDIFGQNSIDESMVKKVFDDRTWSLKQILFILKMKTHYILKNLTIF
ncbi:MAG: hypothetical protein Ct9H90mP10_04130 [Actinomycetota bacterium]|nr:MAG: hypothetical protein Ct9H90mP10_04130 [Actinomycetota bacterium]